LCPALIFFSFSSFFFLAHFVYLIIGCHPSALKIQNQLIIFDGQLEHASVAASDSKTRMNININIV
jgi:hypothetical protein